MPNELATKLLEIASDLEETDPDGRYFQNLLNWCKIFLAFLFLVC